MICGQKAQFSPHGLHNYKRRRNEIKTHLQNRGYRSSLFEEQLQKVDELNREDLLQYKDRKENDRVPLVIT
jgi:hypothetical protein